MSDSDHKCVKGDEGIPLNTTPGSVDNGKPVIVNIGHGAASCCVDKHHRKLAICSIVCGISCIGIKALINSVKAEETADPETAAKFSRRAKKFGIISIITWICLLASIPSLLALISYLLTLRD